MAQMAVSLRVLQTPRFAPSVKANNVEQRGIRMNKPMVTVTCADSRKPSGGGSGLTRPRPLSPAMQKFLGVSEIPRTKAIKKIWEYIKEKNLQDANPERNKFLDGTPEPCITAIHESQAQLIFSTVIEDKGETEGFMQGYYSNQLKTSRQ